MAAKLWVGIVAIIAVLVLLFLTVTAQGAPSAPTAMLSTSLNPTQSQSVQVTFQTQFYSLVSSNSIYQLGSKFVYSAVEQYDGATPIVLAQNLTVPATPVSVGSGGLYVMSA